VGKKVKLVKKVHVVGLFLVSLLFTFNGFSQEAVFRIDIEGNEIVSDATIVSRIKIRAGQPYNENVINSDVKNLYAEGFFEDVTAEREDAPGGVVVVFKVKEKPVLAKIIIEGDKFIRAKRILEVIDIKEGAFTDEYKVKEAVRKIKDLYIKKGFSQAEINYQLINRKADNKVEVKFIIDEKKVLKVRKVIIDGNKSISTRRILKLMKTRKAWLFNRGLFKEDVLQDDVRRVEDYYRLKGYSDVAVGVQFEYQPKGVYVTVSIQEGKRYYVGEIFVEGNKNVSLSEIRKAETLNKESIFSEQAVYEDASNIREVYVDRGYIFSSVEPLSVLNPQTGKVDVTYNIAEREVAYIEDIEIKGNVKTKDKVIRRELRIYPGDKFDGKKVRKSKERLENLGFFEEIRFGTEPGTEPDYVDLIVDTKEAKTGYFSFGGGYSSIDEFVGFVELRQRNFDYRNFSTFTGAGQDLTLMFSMGSITDRYQLSFTNPWIFDKPVSFGFDVYKKGHKRNKDVGYGYEQKITGGDLRLGREFNDYWSGGVAYRLERVEISDVEDRNSELVEEEGDNNLSSVELSLSYDSRDNVFSTLKGIYFRNVLQYFGGPLGGDKDFIKYFNRVSFYFPTINKSVIELRLRGGISDPFSDTSRVPIYERFFAGGASTIRGYRERKVGPVDSDNDPLGGEAMFVGNIEYTYPCADFLKVATFFDTGNVWAKNSDFLTGNLYSSVGLGLRVKTPIGPVSVDYGWPLDLEPGEETKSGRFHFNVSRAF